MHHQHELAARDAGIVDQAVDPAEMPGGGLDPWGVLFVSIAMLGNATYQLLSRKLASSERRAA